jgi:nicotinamidase-related amidase
MEKLPNERPSLLIIDMVKDNFDPAKNLPITEHAQKIIAPINDLIATFRRESWPIVFSTDAFGAEDFIFRGRMKAHSLAGTPGAEVIEELDRREEDYWLPKPRFSAFFDTGLAHWLHDREITLCAVAGISTHFCVLTTAMDALCHGFKAVLLSDCSAATRRRLHDGVLALYERNPLEPLFSVASSKEMIRKLHA